MSALVDFALHWGGDRLITVVVAAALLAALLAAHAAFTAQGNQIGRASCRARV